jgi:hypothetical protein
MAKLLTYGDFIERVNELGFMAFSNLLDGFPSLTEETPERNWHTGNHDTDPWCWKDRAAEEKKLAFGCILGGNKGFVSERVYPLFLAAMRPRRTMQERRSDGLVSQAEWELWKLFEEKRELDTGDIRRQMGVTKKKGGSRVEAAARQLQQEYYITVAGSRQKLDRAGQPYGWHINVYNRVEDWAPASWLGDGTVPEHDEAIEEILDLGVSIGRNIDRGQLLKALGMTV